MRDRWKKEIGEASIAKPKIHESVPQPSLHRPGSDPAQRLEEAQN